MSAAWLEHGNGEREKKKRKCRTRRKCSQAMLRRLLWFARVTFNNADKRLYVRSRCNSHWLCPARRLFHPEKAEEGEKVGEKSSSVFPVRACHVRKSARGEKRRPTGRSSATIYLPRWPLTRRFTIQMIREGIIEMEMSGSYIPGYRSPRELLEHRDA